MAIIGAISSKTVWKVGNVVNYSDMDYIKKRVKKTCQQTKMKNQVAKSAISSTATDLSFAARMLQMR